MLFNLGKLIFFRTYTFISLNLLASQSSLVFLFAIVIIRLGKTAVRRGLKMTGIVGDDSVK